MIAPPGIIMDTWIVCWVGMGPKENENENENENQNQNHHYSHSPNFQAHMKSQNSTAKFGKHK